MANKPFRTVQTESMNGERIPPQNLEAEKSLLGGMMLSKEAMASVNGLNPEDFYRERHARIFEIMLELNDRNEPIDILTLGNALSSRGLLESVGGRPYIVELMEAVPTSANVEYYAKIVAEKSTLRKLINTSTEMASRAYDASENPLDLLHDAEKKIFEIAQGNVQQRLVPIGEVILPAIDRLQDIFNSKGAVTGVATGFAKLDQLTSGFQPGSLIIVAARPGMGKTSLVLNMALHCATYDAKSVAFFSLEMGKEELVTRMLCSEAKIDISQLRKGMMELRSWEHLTKAATLLSSANIYFDDQGVMDIRYIMGKCRRQKAEGKLDIVIIDYLQLMVGQRPTERREQEISEISRGLKAMAKELKVPVIALSQLNRGVESRQDKRPMMSDLRESGAIEQDADMIGFIYRPELYAKDDKERHETRGLAEFIIAKNRNGPTDTIKMTFQASYTRFEDFADENAHGGPPNWE